VRFEWNSTKAAANLTKHGVSFQEAATVFRDPLSVTGADPDHSYDEERFITMGASTGGRLLTLLTPTMEIQSGSSTRVQ
jgi:uncharacterized protein